MRARAQTCALAFPYDAAITEHFMPSFISLSTGSNGESRTVRVALAHISLITEASKGLTVIRLADGFEIRVQQPFHEVEAAIDAAQSGLAAPELVAK
jgi:hypothetical protein